MERQLAEDQELEYSELIKEAYAATLDPSRIDAFEKFWEAYIDSELQNRPKGFDFDGLAVNAHIETALKILNRIKWVNAKETAAQHLVDSHYGFGFIVDNTGRIIAVNNDADRFAAGRLHLKNCGLEYDNQQEIIKWMNQKEKKADKLFRFFHVFVNRSKKPQCWFLSPITLDTYEGEEPKRYFLITSVEQEIQVHSYSAVGRMYLLTEAEAEVASLLCNRRNPKEIAEERSVKISAVRSQIASIKSKMQARDIPDIVHLITRMSLRENADRCQITRGEAYRKTIRNQETIRENSITLPDGRNYQYFEQGRPHGPIILNIHSLFDGVVFPQKVSVDLVRAGFRLISPVRAGFGESDSNISRNMSARIDNTVKDMKALLDHISLTHFYILTGWSGAIAQRLAGLYPKRCLGLVLSGSVPVWNKSHLETLPARYRNMIKTSIHAPSAVSYLVRIAKALIDGGRERQFIASVNANNVVDSLAMEDPDIYDCVVHRHRFLMKQNIRAFVEDLEIIHTDWQEEANRLTVPVRILTGRKNTYQPQDAISKYLKRVPDCKVKYIKGAGSHQNLTHFSHILEVLNDFEIERYAQM